MRGILSVCSTVLMICLSVGCNAEQASPSGSITGSELAQRIDARTAPLILDVRSEAEFAAGHVPGATLVPHGDLASRLPDLALDPSAEIVVYCEKGGRANEATRTLQAAGFTNVRHLEGDMSVWRNSDLPCEGC